MTRKILIEIPGAGEKFCNHCANLQIRSQFMEYGPTRLLTRCDVFRVVGELDLTDMPRPQACLDAERAAGEDHE